MPLRRFKQTSFASGEFAPGLRGRTDFARYSSGCAVAHNFFVSPWGTLMNRAGTEWVSNIYRPIGPAPTEYDARLIPFIFSDSQAVMLLFIANVAYVFAYNSSTGRAEVVFDSDGAPVTIPHEFDPSTFRSLRHAQVGDVIIITNGADIPLKIERLSSNNRSWRAGRVSESIPDYSAATPFRRAPMLVYPLQTEDASNPAMPWQWKVTQIWERDDGTQYETLPWTVGFSCKFMVERWSASRSYGPSDLTINRVYVDEKTSPYDWDSGMYRYWYRPILESGPPRPPRRPTLGGNDWWEQRAHVDGEFTIRVIDPLPSSVVCTPAKPVTISWQVFQPETYGLTEENPPDGTLVAHRVYRGMDGRFGFIAQTTEDSFTDEGATPDYSRPPPSESDIFEKGHPAAVTHFEGRRVYGGHDDAPSLLDFSAVEEWDNFSRWIGGPDTMAVRMTLASNKLERVRDLIPRERLVVLTDTAEWVVTGSGTDEVITPTSFAARMVSEHGTSQIGALAAGGAVFFIQRKGGMPRALLPGDGYKVLDIGVLSRHLFQGRTVKGMAWLEDPWSQLWLVMDDGTLRCCTWLPDYDLIAWTKHTIQGGTVVDVATIPEGSEDTLYLVTRRDDWTPAGNRPTWTVERMASRDISDVKNAVHLDACWRYDGRNTDSDHYVQVNVVGGDRDKFAHCTVYVWGESTIGELEGKRIRVHHNGKHTDITLGQPDAGPSGSTVYGTAAQWSVVEDYIHEGLDGQQITQWSTVTSMAQLQHLRSGTVYALVDGNSVGPFTADGNAIDLGVWGEVIVAGLQFDAEFESLAMPDADGRVRNLRAMTVRVQGARGGYVGQSLDGPMEELPPRRVDAGYEAVPLIEEDVRVPVSASWGELGKCALRQTEPLPITILSIIREVEYGGG